MLTVWPWRHWVYGTEHFAECTTCGAHLAAWRGPDTTPPSSKNRAVIEAHITECGAAE